MARTKTQVILRYLIYGMAGVALVASVGYFLIIRPLQINKEKANFTKAETQLDALAAQIENTVGKPDDQKKEKSCRYISQEYGNGPRSCVINIAFIYLNKDAQASTNLMDAISKHLGGVPEDRLGRKEIKGFNSSVLARDQLFYQHINDIGGLDCSLQYTYPTVPTYNSVFKSSYAENLQIDIGCSGSALTEYFPIKK